MVESRFNISGSADHSQVGKEIEKERLRGMTPIAGELDKTAEQLQILEQVNKCIDQECKALGVMPGARLLPQQVHVITAEIFSKMFGNIPAISVIEEHAVYIRQGPYSSDQFAHLMMHEALHPRGFQRYYGDAATDTWLNSRSGFVNVTRRKTAVNAFRSESLRYFESLNEAVVEKMTLELLEKEGRRTDIHNYEGDRQLLGVILRIIAEKNSEEMDDVWKRFKRSNFTGELMHLRELERALEPGALRLYAHINPRTPHMIEWMQNYLSATDPQEKEKIAHLILRQHLAANQREADKYRSRSKKHNVV